MSPQPIICRAAVVFGPQENFQICNVIVAPPKAGEVRVKVLHAAPCHTDEFSRSGGDPEGKFPCILGHEAAGIVEAVGEGVETCQVGDPVVLLYQAECFQSDREKKSCQACDGYSQHKTNLCQKIRSFTGKGIMRSDGGSRFKLQRDESVVYHYMGVSGFSEFTVVHQESVATVIPTAPLDRVCLLGCGVATGLGAVWNTHVERGASVAVFGVGAVGLACIEAARIAGASKIVAIDRNRAKEAVALRFGATDFLCPLDFQDRDIQGIIIELFNGGVDYSFECTGNVSIMRAAFECTKKGWGICVVLGVAKAGEEIRTRPFHLICGRQWRGSAYGGWRGRTDIGKLIDLDRKGTIDLSRYVTHRLPLDRVNEAFDLLRSGTCIRCVLQLHSTDRRNS